MGSDGRAEWEGIRGDLSDSLLTFEYRALRHAGFTLGVERFNFDLRDEDESMDWRAKSRYDGYLASVKIFF